MTETTAPRTLTEAERVDRLEDVVVGLADDIAKTHGAAVRARPALADLLRDRAAR